MRPPDDAQATRMSDKFVLPEEALPSEPPAPRDDATGMSEGPSVGKATTRMAVPESITLLRAALPTPGAFDVADVQIPASAPAPRIDLDLGLGLEPDAPAGSAPRSEEGAADALAAMAPASATPGLPRAREIASAVALFAGLVVASAIVLGVIAAGLFR